MSVSIILEYVAFISVSAFCQLLCPSKVTGMYGANALLLGTDLVITWRDKEDEYEYPTKHLAMT